MKQIADTIKVLESVGIRKYLGDLTKTNVHDSQPTSEAQLSTEMRYPAATRPFRSSNQHGEIEMLGDVEAIHWFVAAEGITWHFVTTGNPENEPVLFIHGFPESWYAYHHQMEALADKYYTVAVDVLAYGQSDKRETLDYTYPAIARALAALINKIGLDRFHLVGHDRGSVISDHLLNVDDMNARVIRYVRMQQSASEPHGDPVPPHKLLAHPHIAPALFKSVAFPRILYEGGAYVTCPLESAELERLDYEFKYQGIAEAAPLSFQTTSFDKELADRHNFLFAKMIMPVLFLQGTHDPGQHREEYEYITEVVPTGRPYFLEANHFMHLEEPQLVTNVIRQFLMGLL